MKVEVNVEKKYALMIIASVLILAGAIGIYAILSILELFQILDIL